MTAPLPRNPYGFVDSSRFRQAVYWSAFALLFALAAFSRFYRLDAESLWFDETTTWERASLPLPELIEDSRRRLHNPLYFLMIHALLPLGDSEFMLRLPSAIVGTFTLLCTALLGHICGGPRAALSALLLLGISPLRLRFDQEARMYAQFGLGVAIMLCGLMWLLQHPREAARPLWRRLLVWGAAEKAGQNGGRPSRERGWAFFALFFGGALSLYTHNTATLALLCVGLSVLASLPFMPKPARLPFLGNYAVISGLTLVAYLPWLSSLLWQTGRLHEHFWAVFPDARELRNVGLALYLFGGFRASIMLFSAALLVAAVVLLRRRPRLLIPLLLCAFLTPLLILLISLKRPIFIDRLMLWVVIPYVVLLAVPLARLPRALYALAMAGLLLMGGSQLEEHYFGVRKKPDFRAAVSEIARHPGAVALLAGGREAQQFRYYTQRRDQPIAGVEFHSVAREDEQFVPVGPFLVGKRRAFVVRRRSWKTVPKVLAEVRRHGRLRGQKYFGHGLQVFDFELRGAR